MEFRGSCWLSGIALAAVLAPPDLARACSYPTSPHEWFKVHPPPANGVLIVDVSCTAPECNADPLMTFPLPVIDLETGELVPGRIVHRRAGVIAFKPDTPFVAGRSYALDWQPAVERTGSALTFTAVQEVPSSASNAVFDVALEARSEIVSEPCVPLQSLESLCGRPSYAIGTQRYLLLQATDVSLPPSGQTVVSFAAWTDGAEPPDQREYWPWPAPLDGPFEAFSSAADAYCYRLEITSLIDDSFAVQEDCIAHGDLGELGTTLLSPREQESNRFVMCSHAEGTDPARATVPLDSKSNTCAIARGRADGGLSTGVLAMLAFAFARRRLRVPR